MDIWLNIYDAKYKLRNTYHTNVEKNKEFAIALNIPYDDTDVYYNFSVKKNKKQIKIIDKSQSPYTINNKIQEYMIIRA